MAFQLSSLAASAGLCLLSALAAALLVLTLYVLGVVASFAVFCVREFARRDPDRPPLMGTAFRQLKNFDRLFDEHVKYALAHRTCRLAYHGHSELFTADPAVVEHVLKTSFSKYSKKAREDILSRFIIASKEDPETINDRYLRDIVLNFLIAGKDTTGNTLSWFFYMLCKNPIVQDKVALEIKEFVKWAEEDNNTEDFTARLNDGAIDKMHYLHAAISETLRLYPAVPVDGKMVEEDDVLPNGYKAIKGDGMNYMIYAMGRMTYLWGEDAEDFKPERWIANGVFQQESPYKFVSFNAGPRICLGKEFAYRQMKIMAATLIHFFRFKLADESKDATYKTMFTLHMDKGLQLYAYPRST